MKFHSLTHLMPDEYLLLFAREGNWAWRELLSRGLIDWTAADAGEPPEGAKW